MIDVECEAEWLLRPFASSAPGARAVAAHHLGPRAIYMAPVRGGNAERVKVHGATRICLRSKLPKTEKRWAILHEIAEWHLDELAYEEEDREAIAEALTAALVTPRSALRRHVSRSGRDLPALAEAFTATQTSVALRLGEVRCVEASVVVRPGLVRVRAPDGYVLPSEHELRRAADGAASPLERHVLTDAKRRVALLVA